MAAAQQQQLGAHPPVPEAGAGAAESQGEGAWQAGSPGYTQRSSGRCAGAQRWKRSSGTTHKFAQHLKAWGVAHTGPGIRFICESNAVDDPDHRGFWTTLPLWNRGRHEIYKDDRGPRRSDTSGRAAGGEGTGEPGGEQRQGAAGDKEVL